MHQFRCTICKHIFDKPMILPCWKTNFCLKCIINLSNPNFTFKCKSCGKEGLITRATPNTLLERLANLYKKELNVRRNITTIIKVVPDNQEKHFEPFKPSLNTLSSEIDSLNKSKIQDLYNTDEEDLWQISNRIGFSYIDGPLMELNNSSLNNLASNISNLPCKFLNSCHEDNSKGNYQMITHSSYLCSNEPNNNSNIVRFNSAASCSSTLKSTCNTINNQFSKLLTGQKFHSKNKREQKYLIKLD